MNRIVFVLILSFGLQVSFDQQLLAQFEVNPERFGCKGDAKILKDGEMTIGDRLLTSASASFSPADVGKIIFINEAGINGSTLIATITTIVSSKKVTLNTSASATATVASVTYGTDCTKGFIKINKVARDSKKQPVIINLKNGIYLTRFNNWLAGIRDVTINGNGASIMCTNGAYNPNGIAAANIALFMPSCLDNVDNNYYGSTSAANLNFGYRIHSNRPGDKSIGTVKIIDSKNFKAGNWIMIGGYEQELLNGFPPDWRYFEYAKVVRVDTVTGVITLDRPVFNKYDEGWVDYPSGEKSAPRIVNLNRPDFNTIENLLVRDLNFPAFPGWKGALATNNRNGRISIYGYIKARFVNVTASGAYLGQGENLELENCKLLCECEADKLLDSLTFENNPGICNLASAGGVNFLILTKNVFNGTFGVQPRHLYMEGNTMNTKAQFSSNALATIGANKYIEYARIGENFWTTSTTSGSKLFSTILSITMPVDSILDDTTVLISFMNWKSNKDSRGVQNGSFGKSPGNKTIKVTRVYCYNDTYVAVQGKFSSKALTIDIFKFGLVNKIEITGQQMKNGSNVNNKNIFDAKSIFITPSIKYYTKKGLG